MPTTRSIGLASFRTLIPTCLLLVLLAIPAQEVRSEDCVPGWETFPVFQTNAVYAICEYEGIVYRGGWFSLFRWVEDDWEILDIGGDMGTLFVADFTALGELLVIGGYFPTAGGATVNSIATWDGADFGALGAGVDGEIRALVMYDGDLIAGGSFGYAGGNAANNIARWDGSAWHPLGSGATPDGTSAAVWDMAVWQGDLYVVGDFTHAGGVEVSYVARWDGSTWSDVGGGVSMIGGGPTGLRGVDAHNGKLVIVGALDFAGGVEATNIAQWDGVVWSPLGSGSDPYDNWTGWRQAAHSVASYKGLLYVGADFDDTVGDAAEVLAVWDGVSWEAVDNGLEGPQWPVGPNIRDLEVAGEGVTASLLMGGNFNEANGEETDNVARYTNCDEPTGVAPETIVPRGFYLESAVPNPFNPITEIRYGVPALPPSRVKMEVYDATGRMVTTLVDADQGAGTYTVVWDGRDHNGSDVASGVYFYRLVWQGKAETRRMVLLK
jgi:hypothetical protein